MRRTKTLCGILTVLIVGFTSGCSSMMAQNDLVLEPQGATAFERALDYEEQQEFALAAKEYEAAIEADAKDSQAWVNLGLIHQREGRQRHAIASWQNAIRANPKDARAYNLLGNIWMEQEQYSKAVAYYRRATEADPSLADAHWNMAGAYRHLGMDLEAGTEYRQFAQLSADAEGEDAANAKIFVAELGAKDPEADIPAQLDEMVAEADTEPANEEVPLLLLDHETATIFVGETIEFAETEPTETTKPTETYEFGLLDLTKTAPTEIVEDAGDVKASTDADETVKVTITTGDGTTVTLTDDDFESCDSNAKAEKSTDVEDTRTEEAIDEKKAKIVAELEAAVKETEEQASGEK